MTKPLFHEGGPEGRNQDAAAFEQRLVGLWQTLGWTRLESNVDSFLRDSGSSQGMDAIAALPNPRTGRNDGWICEAKRHSGPERYSIEAMRKEAQILRTKVGRLHSQRRFFEDPDINQHVDRLCGGVLIHHSRKYRPGRVREILREVPLSNNETGPRPPRVLFVGPDTLNGFGEAITRFGPPTRYWWPTTEDHDGRWSRACPPEQLAAGLLIYETDESGHVLLLRDSMDRHDVEAVAEIAWRFGGDFDVVACTALTDEGRRLVSDAWHRVAIRCSERSGGAIPERVMALDVPLDSMASFERTWPVDGDPPAADRSVRQRRTPRRSLSPVAAASLRGRRRVTTAYPSALSVQRTFATKANLQGSKRTLAGEGLLVFADDKQGTATLAGEVWLLPRAYRSMGHLLDVGTQVSVCGLRLRQMDGPATLPDLGRGSMFEEFVAAAGGLRDEPFGDRGVRMQMHEVVEGHEWPYQAELVYDDVYDLVGGERICDEVRVSVVARPSGAGEVDVAMFVTSDADRTAAATWISDGMKVAKRGWFMTAMALPTSNPDRAEALVGVVEAAGGTGLLGVGSPDLHRGSRTAVDQEAPGFVRGLRHARYDTEIMALQEVLDRARQDCGDVGELTVFSARGRHRTGASILAIRARQKAGDAYLSLAWRGGKHRNTDGATNDLTVDEWQGLASLDLSNSERREMLLASWTSVVDAQRRSQDAVVARLRSTG